VLAATSLLRDRWLDLFDVSARQVGPFDCLEFPDDQIGDAFPALEFAASQHERLGAYDQTVFVTYTRRDDQDLASGPLSGPLRNPEEGYETGSSGESRLPVGGPLVHNKTPANKKKPPPERGFQTYSGGRIRTCDLRVMRSPDLVVLGRFRCSELL
jgi:hypothetical protein